MKISLDQAFALLERASAVILPDNDRAVLYPSTEQLTDDPQHQFLFLSWTDDDYHEYEVSCVQANNAQADWDGDCLTFLDENGDEIQLRLLVTYQELGRFKSFVDHELVSLANDVNQYLKHSSVPIECHPQDVDRKINHTRNVIQAVK